MFERHVQALHVIKTSLSHQGGVRRRQGGVPLGEGELEGEQRLVTQDGLVAPLEHRYLLPSPVELGVEHLSWYETGRKVRRCHGGVIGVSRVCGAPPCVLPLPPGLSRLAYASGAPFYGPAPSRLPRPRRSLPGLAHFATKRTGAAP